MASSAIRIVVDYAVAVELAQEFAQLLNSGPLLPSAIDEQVAAVVARKFKGSFSLQMRNSAGGAFMAEAIPTPEFYALVGTVRAYKKERA
jgi:hypothetical protein